MLSRDSLGGISCGIDYPVLFHEAVIFERSPRHSGENVNNPKALEKRKKEEEQESN
jgi:hypothetical protein